MLQRLSDKIQGLFAWTVLSTVAITFIFFGINYYTQSKSGSNSEITINNQKISNEEYMLAYKRLERSLNQNYHNAEFNEQQLKKRTLETLIINHITLQGAKDLGLAVSPKQATDSIKLIPQFQKDGAFSRKAYQAAINAALFTPISFQQQVQQGMIVNQQKFALMGTQFVLPSEFKDFVGVTQQERNIRYTIIPVHDFSTNIDIAEPEIKAFYQINQNNFREQQKVSVEFIKIGKSDIAVNPASQGDLEAFYEENISAYQSPKKWQIETIAVPDLKQGLIFYNELKAKPQNFNQIAKKFHYIPTKSLWISDTDKNNAVLNAIEVLDNNEKVSYPVKLGDHYEIVHILKSETQQLIPFNSIKNTVSKDWEKQQKENLFDKTLDKISEISYEYPDSLDGISKQFRLKIMTTDLFSQDGEGLGELRDPAFIKAAFSPDVINSGNNSDVIVLENGDAIVLRLKTIQMPRIRSLNDVKDQIIKELKTIKQQNFVKDTLENFVKQYKTHNNSTGIVLNKKTYAWKSYEHLNRDSENIPAEVLRCAFDAEQLNTPFLCPLSIHAYAIMEVLKIKNGSILDMDAEQQSSIQEQLQANYGISEYENYINNMIKTAKIIHG
jgi:peptidyl-prolyl cis-trans isomerase D